LYIRHCTEYDESAMNCMNLISFVFVLFAWGEIASSRRCFTIDRTRGVGIPSGDTRKPKQLTSLQFSVLWSKNMTESMFSKYYE
jgi:hypothetical protein